MRRTVWLLATLAATLLVACGAAFAQAQPPQNGGEANRYIVVLDDDVSSSRNVADAHARSYGATVTTIYSHALNGYAAKVSEEGLRGIRQDPRVDFVQQDYVQHAFDDELPTGVNRIDGELSPTAKIDINGIDERVDANVAVIDTGINKTHPDLNVAGGRNFATFFSSNDNYEDGNGHGTHVAGTIAALDNNYGAVGVAPGAKLYGVKVLSNSGTGWASWIIKGIDWVTGRKAEFKDGNMDGDAGIDFAVANMSLGGSGTDGSCGSDAYHKAICNSVAAGVTYAVAAGNSNADLQNFVPATYSEVLTVTAVSDSDGNPGGTGAPPSCRSGEKDDYAATFSNYATLLADQEHTIAAPGVCIYSTWTSGGYNTISGTSMASPHVAGTAALCIASGQCKRDTNGDGTPDTVMTPSQVISKLRSDAATKTNGDSSTSGYYGFKGDPNTPNGTRYYGFLEYAGGY